MAGGTTYKTLIDAVAAFLKESGSTNQEQLRSNREIVEAIRNRIAQGTLNIVAADGTILNYLSQAANNDPDSPIVSGGPRGGYWYEELTAPSEKPVESEEVQAETGKPISIVEKDLYPLMELWLEKKGFTSKDLSTLKSGGPWGNPDIIGAQRVELFGAVQIELASCEVKLRDANWEKDIFEAISHKRFSNRSWFCYRVDNDAAPLPKGIEYYAERYRVGVVQIVLNDEELIALKQQKKVPLDFIERVEERVPALYDYVPLREQRDLIERSGITLALSF